MRISLRRHPGKDNIIRVIDPCDRDFGNIDIKTARGYVHHRHHFIFLRIAFVADLSCRLVRIMDSKAPKFRLQAKLAMRVRKPNEIPGKEVSEYYDILLNLYGPKKNAVGIGRHLSQKQVWLRTPISSDAGIEVCNPHAPVVSSAPRTSYGGPHNHYSSGNGYVTRTVEEIRNDVVGMFDSLQKSEDMPEMDASTLLKTSLLKHQKQGLFFLSNREKARVFSDKEEDNTSLWRLRYRSNGKPSYYNVITGKEEVERPPEVLGGILADMMGLGKTLSILALVVNTLDECEDFARQPSPDYDGDKPLIRNSKSTLLIAPLSTLANWEEQIAAHLLPQTLKYYIYHGSNRTTDVDELAKYDLVITTYSIVSSDFCGRGTKKASKNPLLQTNFFRIVLDEAHMIREQATRQSQAICALSAQRRWAVTGTPVQNRLDDLGALIKFLRVYPFNEKGGFSQFILSPFKNSDPEILPKLRLLVASITLRRLKDRIDLPPRNEAILRLEFSDEEKQLYEWFAKDSQAKVKVIANEQKKSLGGKTYAHILRAIMRLRLLCAHGRELLSEDDLKIAEGFSKENAIDLEAEEDDYTPQLNARQAYEMLMLLQETASDTCVLCQRSIHARDEDDEKDETLGYMLPCYQILCRECLPGAKATIDAVSHGEKFKCPYCDQVCPQTFFELTKDGIEQAEEAKSLARENPRQAKIMGRYCGPHTKVKALIEHLQSFQEESRCLPDQEPPIKSVVFSGWTSNLDLIQIALEENKIPFCRLDGKMSRKARGISLESFREDPTICVILISIQAGGLGLNLTSASKVFVMEPQFNPASEQQAVERVHRLGQKREVSIYHMIMNQSFEEKMLDLQRKKQNLADLSMNRGKLDRAEAVKRKLDELRSLFK